MSQGRKLLRKAQLKGKGAQLQQAAIALQANLQALESGGLKDLPRITREMVEQTNRAVALVDAMVGDYTALEDRLGKLEGRVLALEEKNAACQK